MSPLRQIAVAFALGAVVVGSLSAAAWAQADAATAAELDYNRDIRPILSNHCFACHGPDEGERHAGLRLDDVAAASQPADSGKRAIVPGKPEESELVARIFAADEAERMPPPDSNKTLTAAQKDLLKRWIAAGAKAQVHWAFIPPQRPKLPEVENRAWAKNEIDLFVLDRLEREPAERRPSPSPPADRLTLIRRVTLDLIGLLPTPEEAEAFARDERPEAYEELVDRLLKSPHYGERWARRWLDLARYADTNGYEKDRPRSIWPYRDWVINALNNDLPFDRFTIEQLAGDLLSDAGPQARVATGFHRNTMVNEEGGIDVEEFRFHAVVDRVSTTSATWLGLTIGCAQCHTHKFDPISHGEYYGLFAFLNNADEPELEVPQEAIARKRAEIQSKITELERQRAAAMDESRFIAWSAETAKTARPWTSVAPSVVQSQGHATMTVLDDASVLVTGDKPNQDTYVVELDSPLARVSALRLEVLPHASLPEGGPGRAPLFSEGDFLLGEFSVALLPAAHGEPEKIALHNASHSYAGEKTSAAAAIDGDLDTGWSIKGRTGEPHQAVFPLAQPLEPGGRKLRITLEQRYIHQMTIGRFRLSLIDDQAAQAAPFSAEVESGLCVDAAQRTAEQLQLLRGYYASISPELAEWNKQIGELRKSMPRQPTTLVMQERAAEHARTTHLHLRGEFLSPREAVEPGVPAVLHPLPEGAEKNRLTLARWLVDPRNPLVGRVVMNRHWQAFFGRGLVRTSEDFGLRGELPSHPELLDFLATEFVARGWSIKRMHRLMVTSATYQQSSRRGDEDAHDPENVLLARGPRLRLEAEAVRDMALCASGLLNPALGGPSVYPPQPAGVTDLAYGANAWPTSQGGDRYRRGLYTYTKRTSPYAAFITFDGVSGENCVVRRERSNTPLQALTVLNDTVFVEAAQALARKVTQATSDPRERATLAFRRCLTRSPGEQELADLLEFYQAQRRRLAEGQLDARTIAGLSKDENTDAAEAADLAAWTVVARAILNLDEFITKQ